jgi:sulfur-carrier protein adenylyltransferase/sulfurtransferase
MSQLSFPGRTKLSATKTFSVLEPRELMYRMKKGRFFLLLDVRGHEDYLKRHIQGAHNIPLEELKNKLRQLSRLTEIAVYCQRGDDCYEALKILDKAGYKRIHHLRGGINAWIEQVEPDLLATNRSLT